MTSRYNKKIIIITVIFVGVMTLSFFAPYIFTSANKIQFENAFMSPCLSHPCGTDEFGRDMLVRIIYGLRTSICIAVLIEIISLLVGIVIGLIVGFYGGIYDDIFNLVISVFWGFPKIIIALAMFSVLGKGTFILIVVVSFTHWIGYAKIVRSEVMSVKEEDFILAAKCAGESNFYILFKHILINSVTPLIPMATIMVGHTVMIVSGLAFLGFGVEPPTPEIGIMLKESVAYMDSAPWIAIFPGVALCFATLFFNFYGDILRDKLDPKTHIDMDRM